MLKAIVCCGIPGSGKSTWAKQEISKDPLNWVRINNDDMRAMMNGSVWSSDYEKMVGDVRNYIIRNAFKKNKNVIIDNLNLNRKHFDDVCDIAKSLNKEIQVFEKHFYIDLKEAIERDSKREGKARVGEKVIMDWWKKSGKEGFKFYKPRVEVFSNIGLVNERTVKPMAQDESLPKAIMCDLDGTLALIGNRNPYDATQCDISDKPNIPVVETLKLFYDKDYQIIFCSGREQKYEVSTRRFIKLCLPFVNYQLYMRQTGDKRKDAIVKEEIFNSFIKDKFYISHVLDDRNQVVEKWRQMGLTCFQVAAGDF
jgi:predicted kinase